MYCSVASLLHTDSIISVRDRRTRRRYGQLHVMILRQRGNKKRTRGSLTHGTATRLFPHSPRSADTHTFLHSKYILHPLFTFFRGHISFPSASCVSDLRGTCRVCFWERVSF